MDGKGRLADDAAAEADGDGMGDFKGVTSKLDYVKAARAMGVRNWTIISKHILPNTLTPVITFFPFRVSGAIVELTSLDFLNLGVPSPTPSLGELLRQAKSNVEAWGLSLTTCAVLVLMVVLINFIGEALLQAFDPRRRGGMG